MHIENNFPFFSFFDVSSVLLCHTSSTSKIQTLKDNLLIKQATEVIERKRKDVTIHMEITNVDRAFGSTLSYHITKKYGSQGLPPNSIKIKLEGSAGQSFCAFLAPGVHVELEGDANDYVGKGLSGGTVVVYPPSRLPQEFKSEENIIVGNVCLYGATSGKAFFRGIAAERFCFRNSGAIAVIEGVGDHGCEYMTGGYCFILGSTGRNFAAGMSGGIAYVLDEKQTLASRSNLMMVDLLPLELSEDLSFVEGILKEFYEKTGSAVAQRILAGWPSSAKSFVKVFPKEYQRALRQTAEEEKAHLTNGPTPVVSKPIPAVKDIEDVIPENLDKIRGFMKYPRKTNPYRDPKERQKDWNEIYDFKSVRKTVRTQAARCMECGVPFCQSSHGCPLGNIIPKWNDLVFKEDWREALNQLLQTNNFPEFTGRVCPAPCEGACVLGINEPPVNIKNIECAIIDNAFEKGWMIPQIPSVSTGKKVAIVGGGPSGLAAAAQLNKVEEFNTLKSLSQKQRDEIEELKLCATKENRSQSQNRSSKKESVFSGLTKIKSEKKDTTKVTPKLLKDYDTDSTSPDSSVFEKNTSNVPEAIFKENAEVVTHHDSLSKKNEKSSLPYSDKNKWEVDSSGSEYLELAFDKDSEKITGFTPQRSPASSFKLNSSITKRSSSFNPRLSIQGKRDNQNVNSDNQAKKFGLPLKKNKTEVGNSIWLQSLRTPDRNADFWGVKENVQMSTPIFHTPSSPADQRRVLGSTSTPSGQRKFFKTPLSERDNKFKKPKTQSAWSDFLKSSK